MLDAAVTLAASKGDPQLVELLVAAGAEVYADRSGLDALTRAAVRGDTAMFRRLFDAAAIGPGERIDALEVIGCVLGGGCVERGEEEGVRGAASISYVAMYWEIALDKR